MKKSKKKLIIILTVVGTIMLVLFLGYLRIFTAELDPIPFGTDEITRKVNKIVRSYGHKTSYSVWAGTDKGEEGPMSIENQSVRYRVVAPVDSIFIINYNSTKKMEKNHNEINALFETFLYLRKASDRDIRAVVCKYNHNIESIVGGGTSFVVLTALDFENLYPMVDTAGKTDREIAGELTELWLKYFPYNRYGMEFEDKYKYRENLITVWAEFQEHDFFFYSISI